MQLKHTTTLLLVWFASRPEARRLLPRRVALCRHARPLFRSASGSSLTAGALQAVAALSKRRKTLLRSCRVAAARPSSFATSAGVKRTPIVVVRATRHLLEKCKRPSQPGNLRCSSRLGRYTLMILPNCQQRLVSLPNGSRTLTVPLAAFDTPRRYHGVYSIVFRLPRALDSVKRSRVTKLPHPRPANVRRPSVVYTTLAA